MSNEEILSYFGEKELPQYTESSITDMNAFIEEIEETRRLGYSVDMEEYLKGVRAIATLIRQDEEPIGAIWFVGFSNSILDERLNHIIRNLKHTALNISSRMSVHIAGGD